MSAPAPPSGTVRPDASMSLLTDLVEHALDEGYAEAAARRSAEGPARPRLLLGIGLAAVGLLLATAGLHAQSRQTAATETRQALTDQIAERSARVDRLTSEVARLRASIARARQDRLRFSASGAGLAQEVAALETWTGAAAVVGPAVVVHLEDASAQEQPDVEEDPRAGQQVEDGKVTDRDVQTIVNEVWLAGAEAVAVNGQRLTTLSAIRAAGPNILVGFRPLNPPYDVVAIGDARGMRSGIVDGFAGSYLEVLRNYGIRSSVTTRGSVRLPAAAGVTLRHATVATSGSGS